jgi:hypothetical protein
VVAIGSASRDRRREAPISQKADSVPSLIRFLVIVGVLAALGYAGMFALVNFVTPQPREMTQTISPARLNK